MADDARTTYQIVVGIADPGHSLVVERLVEKHPRFEAELILANAMTTLGAVRRIQPPIVLLGDDSPGVLGSEVIEDMFQASPGTIIIMMGTGKDPSYLRQHEAVFQAVTIMNPAGITRSLDAALDYLDDPEGTESIDGPTRRRNERRARQDWSQVFAERRENSRRT
jgi:chemotaxis response regulator CheB